MRRVLLISSSSVWGTGYLDHAERAIRATLLGCERVLFVPWALADWDEYTGQARLRFAAMGLALDSIHESADPRAAVERATAIFVGGGNTFRLLKALWDREVVAEIRGRVRAGLPYVGSSAGSIVACPTLMTTKDMPIVEPPSFAALDLVPFQISPHYLDPDPGSTHMGETHEERIRQYLEENDRPVFGLREGAMLFVEGDAIRLEGEPGARFFRRGSEPIELPDGWRADLPFSAAALSA